MYFVKYIWSNQKSLKGFVKCDDFSILCCWKMNFHLCTCISVLYNHCHSNIIWLVVGILAETVLVALFYVMCILNIYMYFNTCSTCIFLLTFQYLFLLIWSPIVLIDHDHFTRAVLFTRAVMTVILLQYIFFSLFRSIIYLYIYACNMR